MHGVMVQYRGGMECFWELTYGGKRYRIPGWWQLHDALELVITGELRTGDET